MTKLNPAATGDAEVEPQKPSTEEHTVLVVDDSAMDRHLAGSIVNKLGGWRASFATNGREALEVLERGLPDVVLTDMLMPEMDGLELVQAIRSTYPLLPVILMTAHGSEDIAIQALRKGAASYVPKKSLARDLGDTLEQILSASQSTQNLRRILESLTVQESQFVLENDLALVAPLVAHLEEGLTRMKLCEASGLILQGVALHESLTNAILHGNLELDSSMRETDEKRYYHLARERREQEPYRSRHVFVTIRLSRQEAVITIRDEGVGFDPSLLPDPTDPVNLGRVSGRGLLLIQTFMDRVEHNEKGNQITMTKYASGKS